MNKTAIEIYNILIIGDGKLSHHLYHWFSLLNLKFDEQNKNQNSKTLCRLNVQNWNRQSHTEEDLITQLKSSHLILLTITDSAIEDFYNTFIRSNINLTKQKVIHFSGALTLSEIYGAHPLMTFTPDLRDLNFYEKIFFVTSHDKKITELFPFINNNSISLNAEQKSLYHSLCVTSGNLTQILWNLSRIEFQKLNIPDSAVENYLEQNLTNFKSMHEKALTGPLLRNDQITIEKNKLALKQSSINLFMIYETFAANAKNIFNLILKK